MVPNYNLQAIKAAIREVVDATDGNGWNEIGLKLSRFLFWEFDDYVD